MKRIIAFVLLACMLVLVFASCGPTEKEYKLAIGVSVSNKTATIETEQTVAALVIDNAGKIVACRIDALAVKATLTEGAVDAAPTYKTKMELGDDYNMAKYGAPNVEGGTVKEWYIQSAAFSNYVIGMTASEIAGMKTKEVNAHQISVDEALLSAGCTMQITDICAVVAQAANNAR